MDWVVTTYISNLPKGIHTESPFFEINALNQVNKKSAYARQIIFF